MIPSFRISRRLCRIGIGVTIFLVIAICALSITRGPSVELIDGVEVQGVWLRTDPGVDVGSDLRTWDVSENGVARRRTGVLSRVLGWFINTTKSSTLYSAELIERGARSGFYGDPEAIRSIMRARVTALRGGLRYHGR